MKFILGKKERMTQLFDESGKVIPGTVISAESNTVLQVKKSAVVVGAGARKFKNLNKPQREMIKKAVGEEKGFARLKEFSISDSNPDLKTGDKIDVSVFTEGDKVTVSAVSKGKGFQGVVKRHGFHGGPRSHGQKHSEREPGSIGVGGQQRVMRGMRMAGRMGGDRITVKNLIIARIDKENNQLFIKGAVPGRKGTLVEIVSK